jgi:hypothetical protein
LKSIAYDDFIPLCGHGVAEKRVGGLAFLFCSMRRAIVRPCRITITFDPPIPDLADSLAFALKFDGRKTGS